MKDEEEEKKKTEEEKEEEEEEEEEYKPRWEVNYDALYAVDDDVIGEADEILPSSAVPDTKEDPVTESEFEDDKPTASVTYNNASDPNSCSTTDTTDTEVESIRNVILNKASEFNRKDSESSCNDDNDTPTPTHIPSSPPPPSSIVSDPTKQQHIPSSLESKSRSMKRYGRRDTETINASQKQKTDLLLESVQEKLLAAVQEEEETSSSPHDSSKDDKVSLRRSRESKAPERDILFGDLKNMSSGELSPIVEDEDEDEGPTAKSNDLSKLKTLIPGIAEIGSPGLMSPIPVCGSNSQDRTSWGEWMEKFIPSYGDGKQEEGEFDGDDEGDDKFERDSEVSELDSVYSEFDSEYASDDDDVIEYESYQEIEDNLFVMQAVKV